MYRSLLVGTLAVVAVVGCGKTPTPAVSEQALQPAPPPPVVPAAAGASSAAAVFEQRLLPIFMSPNPSSCVQCHLAAVDLKDYILPSSRDTFLALRGQGLIDLEKPEDSKILKLINRGAADPKTAGLIPAGKREAEYEAFAAWIRACAADPALRNAPPPAKAPALATKPPEVVRHARKDRVAESFESNVWSMRFRCMNCHTEGTPQNEKLVKEHGDRVAWFKKGGPTAAMEYLLASKLIDLDRPERSQLLTKPLGEVKHGGGIKFVKGDQGYRAFRSWIEDVAAMRAGKYAGPADLPARTPAPKQYGSEAWLKLASVPPAWGGKLLQTDVYAWDDKAGGWEAEPVATSDRMVGDKGGVWQHTATLLARPGSPRAKAWACGRPSLPSGKYLVKVYVDAAGKAKTDWKAVLGPDEYVGQAEFQAQWRDGYNAMTVVDAGNVRK